MCVLGQEDKHNGNVQKVTSQIEHLRRTQMKMPVPSVNQQSAQVVQNNMMGVLSKLPAAFCSLGKPAQVSNARRGAKSLRSRMPTIVEVECEDFEENASFSPLCLMKDQAMCRRVVRQLRDACPSDRNSLLVWLSTALLDLSLSDFSSEVVQNAFEVASGSARMMLVSKLHGAVHDLCFSPHGHLVLTTLIQTMPVSMLGFAASEMQGNGAKFAQHKYGCRVMEAMIMHCSTGQMAHLSGELALEAVALAKSTHGHSILRHLLEYGTASSKAQIVEHLIPELPSLAMNRTASCVIEAAFEFSDVQEQRSMAAALVSASAPTSLADIACSRHGSVVLAEIARQQACEDEMCACISAALPRLAQSKFGRNVIDYFGLRSRALGNKLEGSHDRDVQLAAAAA